MRAPLGGRRHERRVQGKHCLRRRRVTARPKRSIVAISYRIAEAERVAAWFGLARAEARLATALAAGVSLQDYCALRNVSLNAGRFLLKGVFRKTEVATQAKLVALVSRLPQQS